VFGPLLQQLRDVGYTDRMLAAAPYDWRLPPAHLELRDGFFSRLVTQIEEARPAAPSAPRPEATPPIP
jgi:hypothetical protein